MRFEQMSQVKKKRRNQARAAARMERFLQTKCVVCKDAGELPSRRLSCCSQFCHEGCLLECFRRATGSVKTRCPHCRQILIPYNGEEDTPPVPPGSFPFAFQFIQYNSAAEVDWEERFLNPPIPPPPPGWAAFRQQWRR